MERVRLRLRLGSSIVAPDLFRGPIIHERRRLRRVGPRSKSGVTEIGVPQAPAFKIGRAHVGTPVTNAQLVCRLLLEKKKTEPTATQHKEQAPLTKTDEKV